MADHRQDEGIVELMAAIRSRLSERAERVRSVVLGEVRGLGSDLLTSIRGDRGRSIRSYEAGSTSRRLSGLQRPSTDGTSEALASASSVRRAAREVERNSSYGQRIITEFASDLVGTGIVPQFDTGSDELDRALRDLFDAWSYVCDPVTRGTFYGLQYLQAAALCRDGGCLTRRRMRLLDDAGWDGRRLPVPLALQSMELDHLDGSKGLTQSAGRIVGGIEFDALDQRVAYWLYRSHPGASWVPGGSQGWGESVRVPASEVLHLYPYTTSRPGQTSAVSMLHAVIARLWDFDGWQDASLLARRMTASMPIFVEDLDGGGLGGTPALAPQNADDAGRVLDSRGYPVEEYEPGIVGYIPAGRTVKFPALPGVPQHEESTRVSLREIAAGVGMSYESLSGDLSGVSYISGRMGQLSRLRGIDAMRELVLVPLLVRPCVTWWLDALRMSGRLPQLGGREVSVRYVAPPRTDMDEEKRVKAIVAKIRAGLMTPQDAIVGEGADPDVLLEQLAAWNAKVDDLGVVLETDPRKVGKAGAGATPSDASSGQPEEEPEEEPVSVQ